MGQLIDVETQTVGDVAVLVGDRSLTGQDGEAFSSQSDAVAAPITPTSMLAERLFDADAAIEHVFAQSNVVTVKRTPGWDAPSLSTAAEVLKRLFVYWDAETLSGDMPIGGEGRGLAVAAPPAEEVVDYGLDPAHIESLRAANYNATITSITEAHERLWIMDVVPDGNLPHYEAGQYATLGLGFWEPRIDAGHENLAEGQVEKLARRSYSISSSILDGDGGLLDPATDGSLEFYVVLVEKDWQETPAILTPRLFLKGVGDRIFLGRKIAGRYRLDKLTGDDNDIVFLSTGTGEAPHNRMLLDLLRSGHQGRIVAVCTSRYLRDLGYVDVHSRLMERYDNYRYVAMTTREPENENNKVYIQDFVKSGGLEEALGKPLDPETTHVFLCGNPAMIGIPEWDGDTPEFPETEGVVEILAARGFKADRRGVVGTVHYEEYW